MCRGYIGLRRMSEKILLSPSKDKPNGLSFSQNSVRWSYVHINEEVLCDDFISLKIHKQCNVLCKFSYCIPDLSGIEIYKKNLIILFEKTEEGVITNIIYIIYYRIKHSKTEFKTLSL